MGNAHVSKRNPVQSTNRRRSCGSFILLGVGEAVNAPSCLTVGEGVRLGVSGGSPDGFQRAPE